jgi:O-antigen ligase/polysaccharide polymerase Wzy-like membrane protein
MVMKTESLARRLLKENVVLLLIAMLVVMPLLMPLTHGASGRALRNGLFQAIGILLLVVLLARVEIRGGLTQLRSLMRSGINAPLAAFLLWAALGALRAAGDRAFAMAELLRLGAGALIYFTVVLHLETRAQLCLLIDCLLGIVILLTGYGFIFQGREGGTGEGISSVFPNRHHLSAVLTVLFPLLASLALGVSQRGRRIAAIAAAILCAAGLLLCLERSAWIAAAVGLLVWLFLAGWSAPSPHSRRWWRAALAVAGCGLLVGAGFFAVSDVNAVVADRAREIPTALHGQDQNFAWRVQKWRGTVVMAARRPVWGWGPGQYVLHQYPYTHISSYPGTSPAAEREELRRYGASFDDMAYNDFLQTAAELGFPGLALYLLLLTSFFSKSGRALRRLPEGLRRMTLLGCMAGIAAQMVDALANGSWRYTECTIFFWLVLGLGMAAARMAYQTSGVQAFRGSGVPTRTPTPTRTRRALDVE